MNPHRPLIQITLAALTACCLTIDAQAGSAYQNYRNSAEYQSFKSYRSHEEKRITLAYFDRAIFEARRSNEIFRDPAAAQMIRDLERDRAHAAGLPVDPNGGGATSVPSAPSGASPAGGAFSPEYEEQARAALNAHMEKSKQELQEQMQKDRAYYDKKTSEGVKALRKSGSDALAELDALDAAEAPAPARPPPTPSADEQLVDVFADSSADVLGSLVSNDDLIEAAAPEPTAPIIDENAALAAEISDPAQFEPIESDSLLAPPEGEGGESPYNYGGFGPAPEEPLPPLDPPEEAAAEAPAVTQTPNQQPNQAGADDPAGAPQNPSEITEESAAPARDFESLSPQEQTEVNRKTDELWAQKNGVPAGTQIDPEADPEGAKAWLAQRQEVLSTNSSGPPSAEAPLAPATTPAAPMTTAAPAVPEPSSQTAPATAAPMQQATVEASPSENAPPLPPAPSAPQPPASSVPSPNYQKSPLSTPEPAASPSSTKMSGELGVSNTAGPVNTEGTVGRDSTSTSNSVGINAVNQDGNTIAGGSVKTSTASNGDTSFETTVKVRGAEATYSEQKTPGGGTATNVQVKVPLPIPAPVSVTAGGGTTAQGGKQVSVAISAEKEFGNSATGKVSTSGEINMSMVSTPVNSKNDPLGVLAPGTNKSVTVVYGAKGDVTASVGNRGAKASFSVQDDITFNRGLYTAHSPNQLEYQDAIIQFQGSHSDPKFLGQVARMAEIEKARWAETNNPQSFERARWYIATRNEMEKNLKGTPAYNEYMRQRCIENARALEADERFRRDYRLQQQAINLRHQALLYQKLLKR